MKAVGVKLVKATRALPGGKRAGYWYLRWADTKGRTGQKSLGRVEEVSKADAKRARDELALNLGIGKVRQDRAPSMTLVEFVRQDQEAIRLDVKPSTLRTYSKVAQQAVVAIGGDRQLAAISWQDVAALKAWLGAEHTLNGKKRRACRRATINQAIATMKAALNRAKARGLVDQNPFSDEKLGKVQAKGKRIFTVEEVEVMVEAAADDWWAAFIRLAFTTGLREGELLNLTWADVEEGAGEIVVSAKQAGRFKVGDQTYPRLEFSSKSHQERRVPLEPKAAALLDRLKVRGGGSPYLFLPLSRLRTLEAHPDVRASRQPDAKYLVNNLLRDFKRLQTRARALLAKRQGVELDKVEWRVGTVHDLRKGFGTVMAHRVPMHELRRLMGHASITTTADYYLGVGDDVAAKVRAAFA
jgi:integrase